jgi:sugar (pentulose or hexulose) kinase
VVARRSDGGEGGHGLGLFALAAQATGLGAAAETVERLLPNRTTLEPHSERHALYAELFEVYHEVSRGLLPAFDHLATATGGGTGS